MSQLPTGQTPLAELQRRMELAQLMSTRPMRANTPIGGGLMALAQAFAGRKAAKLGSEVETMEREQRAADMQALAGALQGGNVPPEVLTQLQDPRLQELALALMTREQKPTRVDKFTGPDGLVRDVATGNPLPGQEGFGDDQLVTPQERLDAEQANARARESGNAVARERLDLDRTEQQRIAKKLSAASEKEMIEAQDSAIASGRSRFELEALANDYESIDPASGMSAKLQESFKSIAGSEDALTTLRTRYAKVRNSEAIKNLPPGVATDKDIQLALQGFLPATADPKTVASFLRGLAKMSVFDEAFSTYKARYIDENGGARGLLDAWKKSDDLKELRGGMTTGAQGAGDAETVPDDLPGGMPDGTRAIDDETGNAYMMQGGKWVRAVSN